MTSQNISKNETSNFPNARVFMVYGAHDTEHYGVLNLRNCIRTINKVYRKQKVSGKKTISILENSIITLDYVNTKPEDSPEQYVIEKNEVESRFLKFANDYREPFWVKLRRKIRLLFNKLSPILPHSSFIDDWCWPLYLCLKEKGALLIFEENNSDVIRKELEYRKKTKLENLMRVFHQSHEVDNLRDELLVKQISELEKTHPDCDFVIVRGGYHTLVSKLLRKKGYEVHDYFYSKLNYRLF